MYEYTSPSWPHRETSRRCGASPRRPTSPRSGGGRFPSRKPGTNYEYHKLGSWITGNRSQLVEILISHLVEDALGEHLAVLHGDVAIHLVEVKGGEVTLEGNLRALDGPISGALTKLFEINHTCILLIIKEWKTSLLKCLVWPATAVFVVFIVNGEFYVLGRVRIDLHCYKILIDIRNLLFLSQCL